MIISVHSFWKKRREVHLNLLCIFCWYEKKHLHNNNNEFIIDFDPKSNYLLSQAKFDWLIQHELSVKNQINSHWLWIARSISVKSATKLFIGHVNSFYRLDFWSSPPLSSHIVIFYFHHFYLITFDHSPNIKRKITKKHKLLQLKRIIPFCKKCCKILNQ